MITKFTFFDKFGTQYPASREYKNTLKTKTCENGYKLRELTPDSLQGVKMRFWRKRFLDSKCTYVTDDLMAIEICVWIYLLLV